VTISPLFAIALFVAGLFGGAINSVAGGGSFIVFPTMLLGGVPPVIANATTAAGLWVAGLSSAAEYRRSLPRDRTRLVVLCAMSAIGGGVGAKLLIVTSDQTFVRMMPHLMLAAALVFTFGPRLNRRRQGAGLPFFVGAFVQLLISTYGGFFGGGMGIMMLATFTLLGMTDLLEMNALKIVLGILINGVASVGFILAKAVVFGVAIPVSVGAVIGGWAGAWIARRVDPKYVRAVVLLVAWSLTAWFSYRALALRK
jgi:uncharacterized membrane protein YfcA